MRTLKVVTNVILILIAAGLSFAQTTAVTATITDSTGQAWIGGSYRIDFVAVNLQARHKLVGSAFQEHYDYTALNTSGALSITLPDNHIITPPGSKWKFTICPNATAACSTATVDVHGASMNLSTTLSTAVAAPVVNAQPIVAKAYKTSEVKVSRYAPNSQAALFYDTTANCLKVYSGSSWACISGTPVQLSASYTFYISGGTVYAQNNSTGAIVSSNADAAVVINSTLAVLVNTGGTLYFKNGIYNLNSVTHETTGGYDLYCSICIPSTGAEQYPQINFIGESSNLGSQIGALAGTATSTGVVFNVTNAAETAAGSGHQLDAFWMRPNTFTLGAPYFGHWNDAISFQNISVQFPANTRGKEIAYDMLEAEYVEAIDTTADFVAIPAAASAAGNKAFVSPGTFSDGIYLRNTYGRGFDTIYEINTEHSILDSTYAYHGTTCYVYGGQVSTNGGVPTHTSEWRHPISYDCINQLQIGPHVNPGALLEIYNLDLEYITSGPWAYATGAVETSPGTTGGVITFATTLTGNAGVSFPYGSFFTSGGAKYRVTQPSYKMEGNIRNSSVAVQTTTTTKQTLYTLTIPAKTWLYNSFLPSGTGGDRLRVHAWGTTGANSNSKTFELDWGGTTVASLASTANNGVIDLEADILTSGTSNNAQEVIGKVTDGTATSLTHTSTAIDTSSSQNLILAITAPSNLSGQLASYAFTTVENPLSDSGNFTAAGSGAPLPKVVSSGVAEPTTAAQAQGAFFTGYGAWPNAQYSDITVFAPGSGSQTLVVVRMSGAAYTCYQLNLTATGTETLFAVVTGTTHSIGTISATVATGDVWRLSVNSGNTLTVYQNGILKLTVTDSTYNGSITAGTPGFFLYSNSGLTGSQISNWAGGSSAAPDFTLTGSTFDYVVGTH